MIEAWRDVPGYEHAYEVSDAGRVRSVDRLVPASKPDRICRVMKGRVLQPFVLKNGYPTVNLSRPGGRPKVHYLHHLVLAAFVGPRPDWCEEIRHLDGDKTNPRLGNLAYGTARQNAEDRKIHALGARAPA